MSITDDQDGGIRLRGLLTVEAGATLRAVLDPLAAPRVVTPSGAGDAGVEPSVDERTASQRLADALVEVADRLLAHGVLPDTGGHRPQLLVTVDYDQLVAAVGAGTLPDGSELSPAAVRRLSCDAGIIPAVLGTAGQILDLGRTARTASPAQRRALAVRDRGCAFPGCDRPPGWADAHHIQHWNALGPTDLVNLVLLCVFHHRAVHHDGWEIQLPKDGIRPLFTPPAWIDPTRRPRRNQQHHVRDLLRRSSD